MWQHNYYRIADIALDFATKWDQRVISDFQPFRRDAEEEGYQIIFREVDKLDEFQEECVYHNLAFEVYEQDGQFVRRFHDNMNGFRPYAVSKMNLSEKKICIEYLPNSEQYFGTCRSDFFHIGWEKILIHEKRMILHAACVETLFGGILFSGASGIGKSTQADLWCRYQDGKLLNGDKPIVMRTEEGWQAFGSPYAGSSKCHVNDSCKIRAIVMLQQAEACSIRRMNFAESFRKIYAQITMNSWDKEFVTVVSDMVLSLMKEVPVYELACTPDKDAVDVLANVLEGEKMPWI